MRVLFLLLLAATAPALADDEDAAALLLADKSSMTAEQSSDWRAFVEAAASEWRPQGPGLAAHGARLSIDAKFDKTFAPGWRAVFADRLDMNRMDGVGGDYAWRDVPEVWLQRDYLPRFKPE